MPMAIRSACVGLVDIHPISQIVIQDASPIYHELGGEGATEFCDTWDMESQEKNGGENHLKAWREYNKLTQEALALLVGTTQHQIAYLENGDRALSAKWLRRLAPWLKTTPGMLLDHNPYNLNSDWLEIAAAASEDQQQQITEIARTILKHGKTGTDN